MAENKTMRQLMQRKSIGRAKKILDTLNTEEIMWIKEYVEDRLHVNIHFTYRETHPDYVPVDCPCAGLCECHDLDTI